MVKIGDLVIVLYEKKSYNLIVAEGQTSSTWLVMTPNGAIRRIAGLELKLVQKASHEN